MADTLLFIDEPPGSTTSLHVPVSTTQPNLSSYHNASTLPSHQTQQQQGVGYTPAEAASKVFGDRGAVETAEENKLKNSTIGQLWCRGVVTFMVEFLPSFFYYTLLLVGTSSGLDYTQKALLEAALVLIICAIFVRKNAGHLDPLITIGLVITGKLSLPFYFATFHLLAQALAILLATLVTWGLTPGFDRSLGLGYEHLQDGCTPGQGFAAQLLGCLVQYSTFIWLVCSAGQRNFYEQTGKSYKRNTLFSLAVSFSHMASTLAFGKKAGSNFGWYLHFFPGIISGTLDSSNWWLYFIAPPIALGLALLLYYFFEWVENMAYQTSYKKGKAPLTLKSKVV